MGQIEKSVVLFTSREDEREDAREMTLAWLRDRLWNWSTVSRTKEGLDPVKWTLFLWLIIPHSCISPYSLPLWKPGLFVLSVESLILFSIINRM